MARVIIQLKSLDDRILKDIGIARDEIEYLGGNKYHDEPPVFDRTDDLRARNAAFPPSRTNPRQ